LPITTMAADSKWWRIHRTEQSPVFFGPAPGRPPTYRFDAPGGEYRILYLGQSLSAAFVETLLRNPRIPFIERNELEERSVAVLTNRHPLKLVDLRGGGLSQIGVDNRLTTGSYEVGGLGHWRYGDTLTVQTEFCTDRSMIPTTSARRFSIAIIVTSQWRQLRR
jgi:hypothetical protein